MELTKEGDPGPELTQLAETPLRPRKAVAMTKRAWVVKRIFGDVLLLQALVSGSTVAFNLVMERFGRPRLTEIPSRISKFEI